MANKAQQTVTINFSAKGDDVLIKTIKKLDEATKGLIKAQSTITQVEKKKVASTNTHKNAIKKLRVQLQLEGKSLRDLNVPLEQYKRALKGNDLAIAQLRRTTKGYIRDLKRKRKGILDTEHGTRILGGSFAVLRSKLLLASFGAGIFSASILRLVNVYGQQQKAERLLETAIGKRSRALLNYASEQQKVTAFGDEETIQAMSLVGAYTNNEQAVAQLTKASMNLATAKGMSLSSAVDLVSKSVFSSTNALSRYGITIEGTQGSVERFESATENINSLYKDQAEAFANTLPGSINQLSNSVGDLGERFGQVLAPAILVSAKLLKTFVDSVDTEEIKSYSVAIIGMGTVYIGATKGVMLMNKAMLAFNKISKKNLAILGATLAVGALIDKLDLFADGTKEVTEEIKNLENQLGSLNTKSGITLDQTHKLAMSSLRYAHATGDMTDIEKERDIITTERNHLLEKHGVTNANFGRIMKENTEFAIAYNENRTKSAEIETAHAQASVKASGQMLTALGNLANQTGQDARVARTLAIAGAYIDMYAGANKAFKQGGVLGFASGTAIIAQGLANIESMKAQKFEQGGLVGGQRHSQGGTLIEAERGEFVMSRSAVQSIGLENLNSLNQGQSPLTLNISAPLVDETIVDTIIPAIQKAQRMNLA
tara:strand:- start:12209 stop:14179 length:1971 start_codon:yes stop_codon:yes gene_type:complete